MVEDHGRRGRDKADKRGTNRKKDNREVKRDFLFFQEWEKMRTG